MDAQLAYQLLGALATFGIGWNRVSKAFAPFTGTDKEADPFKSKEKSLQHLALEIQIPNGTTSQKAQWVDSGGTEELVKAIKSALQAHARPTPTWIETYKDSVLAALLFFATLYANLLVIPAARGLTPHETDLSTFLIAVGAVSGLIGGLVSCFVYKVVYCFIKK